MANPYSYDLRQKVIQAIELDSMKKSEAAQLFGVSRNTIDLWLKRRTETGDYQASAKTAAGEWTQNYRLGEVSRVCGTVW